jgi:hypothetical protein
MVNPGENEFQVTQAVGAAVDTKNIELTVELADTAVNEDGGTRIISKEEVLIALDKIKNHILANIWPPA